MEYSPMSLHLRLYRYGECASLSGISIGVTRYPPRGIRREDYRSKGYCDIWLPVLAPSRELVSAFLADEISFKIFASRYRGEMGKGDARHVIELVAAMAMRTPVNIGCFCEDESRCHRSLLHTLIMEAALHEKEKTGVSMPPQGCASPPCSMPEIE